MSTQSADPYEAPTTEGKSPAKSTSPQRFKTGFLHGAFWSLLLVIPTSFTAYTYQWPAVREADWPIGLGLKKVIAVVSAMGSVMIFITIPWALCAGLVKMAQGDRKR